MKSTLNSMLTALAVLLTLALLTASSLPALRELKSAKQESEELWLVDINL